MRYLRLDRSADLRLDFFGSDWDKKTAAIVVDKGGIKVRGYQLEVFDPSLGVLVLNDIDVAKSSVSVTHKLALSLTSLDRKVISCNIPSSSPDELEILVRDSGKAILDSDGIQTGWAQYPLDLYLEGKCVAYDLNDFAKEYKLKNQGFSDLDELTDSFPTVTLGRSDLKLPATSASPSDDLGKYVIATFSSDHTGLNVEALKRITVHIAPRFHSKTADDSSVKWEPMIWQVGLTEAKFEQGGVRIQQSGASSLAIAAALRKNVGNSGEYTLRVKIGDKTRYFGCEYSGARTIGAFSTLVLLVAVLFGF
ncbi:hypothetical protein BLNAU_8545 [Blattamonas nauphoetae]|uniref:Uncharacterized protein n=1 Tax=Blattamonas nauphoetae TaxID=2049346 RepID=A0ABQ9XYC6_9EUKA|nr:hypothetical protein BLNAU_8545 [Blattamonas nauphoetae]